MREELAEGMIKILQPFKNHPYTVTSDNGKEFALHQMISESLGRRDLTSNHTPNGEGRRNKTPCMIRPCFTTYIIRSLTSIIFGQARIISNQRKSGQIENKYGQ